MAEKVAGLVPDAPLAAVTYRVIGLAMKVHRELGPGHRQIAYHNAMVFRLAESGLKYEVEPCALVALADGCVVAGACPDFLIAGELIVELKAHAYSMTRREEAQVIGYFAAFEETVVALYLNFGSERLEYRRLFPPRALQTFRERRSG